MDNKQITRKEDYLEKMFRGLLNGDASRSIVEEINDSTRGFVYMGYSEEEAKQKTLNKYRSVLHRNDHIVDTIIRFDDIYPLLTLDADGNVVPTHDEGQRYLDEFITWIARMFCSYDFSVANGKLIDDPKGHINEMRETFIAQRIVQSIKHGNHQHIDKEKKSKVSIKEIALRYVYEERQITRKNADEIVGLYGHKSGEKLFQEYTKLSSQTNRRGLPTPLSEKKLNNKIAFFTKVADVLSGKQKEKILDDIKALKTAHYDQYQ